MPLSAGLGLRVGLLAFICLSKDLGATITQGPSNTVAKIGEQVKLNCSATDEIAYWILSKIGVSGTVIAGPGCSALKLAFSDHYEVESIGGGTTCNLIVSNITMEQAGAYRCSDAADELWSILTVTEESPTMTSYPALNVVVENETAVSTCSLKHAGSVSPAPTLRPYFYWTDSNGINVTSSYDSTSDNAAVSQLTVTAGRQNITPYRCHVYLQLIPSTNLNYANNTPIVNKTVSSPTVEVLCSPSTPIITIAGVSCGTNILTCGSSGNPSPNYKWFYVNKTVISEGQNLALTEVNNSYTCEAYSMIRNVTYTASANYSVSQKRYSSNCDTNPSDTTDPIRTIILACVLGGYGLLNILATTAFIVYYNRKSNNVNKERQAFTFKNKMTLNARFSWLQRMLPCMNESEGNAGCTFLWVLLFILMSVCAGIIVFLILVAMANCSGERNDAKDDTDVGMSNVYQEENTIDHRGASKSNTDAHGHVDAPYDEIGTVHLGRKVVLEESTSSNPKDAKKVFYTKVNPNFNAEEGVKRYSVSLPS